LKRFLPAGGLLRKTSLDELPIPVKVGYDECYLKNRTLLLDLKIILLTAKKASCWGQFDRRFFRGSGSGASSRRFAIDCVGSRTCRWAARTTELAAEYFTALRAKGIQGSNTDFLICAAAARRDLPVLTTDKDFALYRTVVPLKLHQSRVG